MSKLDLSLVIPMYNEADNIRHTFQALENALQGRPETWEVIFVSDGSTDDTAAIAHSMAQADPRIQVVAYAHNRGRGYALRCGFARAQGAIIVSIDADLSYAPPYILALVDALKNDPQAHIALGSPYMPGGATQGVAPNRLFFSRFGNLILQILVNREIYTWTSIFRAYRRGVLESLDLESDGKEIHLEILTRALAVGYRLKEVPATLTSRKRGKSKFRPRGTILSHLKFIFVERTVLVFGALGGLALALGFLLGLYITYLRFAGTLNPERPLVTMMVILLLGGLQLLSFGVMSAQIAALRREVYRTQKEVLSGQRGPRLPFEEGG
jgi:glycosyltransferase involved in cell wall biosynthesis